jgi:hypothetical protein
MATTPLQARPSNGRANPPPAAGWKGDDAVPRGLAVASAITLRSLIVLAGVLVVALGAARMMLVVLPVIISVLLTQWAAAIVLIVVLTFFLLKDGAQIWDWIVELFHEDRQPVLREVGARAWGALSAYVQGVFLVATIDAVLIGAP